MVKVEVPSAIAAGIKRPGMDAARNNACAMGTSTKNATNKADPAISHERAGEYDRQDRAALAQPLGHEACDRGDAAAVVHELAEQGAQQKQREELRQEARRAAHESLRPAGEQRLHCKRGGEESGGGSEQQHAPAAQREP